MANRVKLCTRSNWSLRTSLIWYIILLWPVVPHIYCNMFIFDQNKTINMKTSYQWVGSGCPKCNYLCLALWIRHCLIATHVFTCICFIIQLKLVSNYVHRIFTVQWICDSLAKAVTSSFLTTTETGTTLRGTVNPGVVILFLLEATLNKLLFTTVWM